MMTSDAVFLSEHDDPVHPAFFKWDDIDDFEMSSRSADSIDEVETDLPHPRGLGGPNVVLLSHTARRHGEEEALAADEGAESELDDVVAEENAGRPEKGFYDVSMFYVNLAPSEEGLTGDDEEEKQELNYYLHPDFKIELLFAQQRKHRHIAQLLKLSDKQRKETTVPIIKLHSDQQDLCPQTPIVTKFRDDSSWIKPVELSPEPLQFIEGSSELLTSTPLQGTSQLLHDVTVDESSTDVPETVSDDAVAAPADDATNTNTCCSLASQYKKEEIPWNVGTVKSYTKDYEQKLKSTKGGEKRSRNESGSSVDSSCCSSDDTEDPTKMEPTSQSSQITETSSPGEACLPTAAESVTGTAVRPTSIYESEDIPFEPGIVRRTKQEIEGRER